MRCWQLNMIMSFCSNMQISHYRCSIIKYVSIHIFTFWRLSSPTQQHASIVSASASEWHTFPFKWHSPQLEVVEAKEEVRWCYRETMSTWGAHQGGQHDDDCSLILMTWLLLQWRGLYFHPCLFVCWLVSSSYKKTTEWISMKLYHL